MTMLRDPCSSGCAVQPQSIDVATVRVTQFELNVLHLHHVHVCQMLSVLTEMMSHICQIVYTQISAALQTMAILLRRLRRYALRRRSRSIATGSLRLGGRFWGRQMYLRSWYWYLKPTYLLVPMLRDPCSSACAVEPQTCVDSVCRSPGWIWHAF